MNEHDRAELVRFAPERIEALRRDFLVAHHGGHHHAAQPELAHLVRELLGREIWMLQRHDAEADESIGVRLDLLRDLLVQQLHVRRRKVAVRPIVLMLEVQADHLDVDALALHRRETPLDARELCRRSASA